MNNEPRDWKNMKENDQGAVFEIQDINSNVIIKCKTFLLPEIHKSWLSGPILDYEWQSII